MKRGSFVGSRKAMKRSRMKRVSADQREFMRLWRLLRAEILQRDGGRCRYCGHYATEVHHVVKRSQDRLLRLDRDNLVSLCADCHRWTDEAGLASRGRLVVIAAGEEKFTFHVQETDKFTDRLICPGEGADAARSQGPAQDADHPGRLRN